MPVVVQAALAPPTVLCSVANVVYGVVGDGMGRRRLLKAAVATVVRWNRRFASNGRRRCMQPRRSYRRTAGCSVSAATAGKIRRLGSVVVVTSAQARLPAELKHIAKRRKRNQIGFPE